MNTNNVFSITNIGLIWFELPLELQFGREVASEYRLLGVVRTTSCWVWNQCVRTARNWATHKFVYQISRAHLAYLISIIFNKMARFNGATNCTRITRLDRIGVVILIFPQVSQADRTPPNLTQRSGCRRSLNTDT